MGFLQLNRRVKLTVKGNRFGCITVENTNILCGGWLVVKGWLNKSYFTANCYFLIISECECPKSVKLVLVYTRLLLLG